MGGLRRLERLLGSCLRGLGFCEGGQIPFFISWCTIYMDIMRNKSLKTLYRSHYNLYGVYVTADDRYLSLVEILDKYKYQPWLEKRHEQLKTAYKVAPVLLKSVTRIEGLLFVFFLAMLIQALIEREVRMGMKKNGLGSISIYPEDRDCESPTTSRLLSLFDNIEFHQLWSQSTLVQTFQTELLDKQVEVLGLAGVPLEEYSQDE